MKAKKPEKNRDRLRRSFREQWATNRPALIVWLILQPVVLAALVRSVMLGSWDNVFICLLVLALFLLPSIVQKNLRITFPTGMQIVILIHIFATEFLGEIACYYVQYPHWDSIVHTVWGFLCAAIGYLLVDLLNRDKPERFYLSPAYLAVAAFCFSMTIGVLWEFLSLPWIVCFSWICKRTPSSRSLPARCWTRPTTTSQLLSAGSTASR